MEAFYNSPLIQYDLVKQTRGPIQLGKNPYENPHKSQIWKGDMEQLLFTEFFNTVGIGYCDYVPPCDTC